MIISILVLVFCGWVWIKAQGAVGVLGLIAVFCLIGGLGGDESGMSIFGLLLLIVWFIASASMGVNTKQGQSAVAERTAKQRKEEEEYGIIDFSEKK